jgi:GntR family transcriptional regulator
MLDRQSALPLYAQLEREIRQKLDEEEWPVNSCIPSESELGRIYGISRMTARSVLNRLTEDGLLYRVPGKGTFVAEPKIQSLPSSRLGMLDQLNQMGYHADAEVMSLSESTASRRVAEHLNIRKGGKVCIARCRCMVEDSPISYHISYLPAELFPNFEYRGQFHHQVIDTIQIEYQHTIKRHTEILQVKSASPEESELLQIKVNAPLLMLDTIYYSMDDIPLDYSRAVFRGDKVKLKFERQDL